MPDNRFGARPAIGIRFGYSANPTDNKIKVSIPFCWWKKTIAERFLKNKFIQLLKQQNRRKMLNSPLSTFPILTTKRLTLRQLLESDVQEIFMLRSDPTINKFLDRKPSETAEDALNFIKNIKKNNLLYWAITENYNGKLIGTICLFGLSDKVDKCEIGYELLTNYQGQGIMNEATKRIIEFAVDTLGIKTIDAFTHKDNNSSTKLLQKFKFEKTAITDEANPDLVLFRLSN